MLTASPSPPFPDPGPSREESPMPCPVLLVCGLLSWGAEGVPDPPDRAAYEVANASVGRDAAAHVGLALWCEARGLKAEGRKHLALAVLIDPKNAVARGLL